MKEKLFKEYFRSPIGYYEIVCNRHAVTSIKRVTAAGVPDPNAMTRLAARELDEYFRGGRRVFDLPVEFKTGTPFQRAVWEQLTKIPYAKTRSYKQVSQALGVRCYRAVGFACGRNPVEIVVPCHRVVGSRGIGGYSAGLEAKTYLLQLEAQKIMKGVDG
ncbi:MAG: methylated-DNA--[protein]-cysteine S-methyltransferase [Thermoprotei archaeon]